MDIQVIVPDINHSFMDFVAQDGTILFGLSAIRNVGEGVVEKILESRADGSFTDFVDFVNRVDVSVLNKRALESLIKAGAFDSLGYARKGLLLSFESILESTLTRRRNEEIGQFSLFGGDDGEVDLALPEISDLEWDKKTRLAFEKEMLGLYISDHPLLGVERALRAATTTTISNLSETSDGSKVTVGGLVGSINRRFTRKGEPMIFFELEDLDGSVEVLCFPKVTEQYGPLVQEDAIVTVKGRADNRGDDIKIVAAEIREPTLRPADVVRLEVPARLLSSDTVKRLKAVLINHPGDTPVLLHMTTDGGHKVVKIGDDHRVAPRTALYAELRELFGEHAIL
jgi:DNA polymerase-3 subunit alpha